MKRTAEQKKDQKKRFMAIRMSAAAILAVLSLTLPVMADELFQDDGVEVTVDPGEDIYIAPEEQEPIDDAEAEEEWNEQWEEVPLIEGVADVTIDNSAEEYTAVRAAEEEALANSLAYDLLVKTLPVLPRADAGRIAGYLAELKKIPSPTGSDGELQTAMYIEETMKNLGYTVTEQRFHEGFLNEDYVDVPGVNIIAERGADSETRSDDIIILCAHYDSKTIRTSEDASGDAGAGTEESGSEASAAQGESEAQGAGEAQGESEAQAAEGALSRISPEDALENDKTGVAVLLETAAMISLIDTDVDVCFLFVSGEEDGGFGAAHFADTLGEEFRDRIRAIICVGPMGAQSEPVVSEERGVVYASSPYIIGTNEGADNEPASLIYGAATDYENALINNGAEDALTIEATPETQAAGDAGFEVTTQDAVTVFADSIAMDSADPAYPWPDQWSRVIYRQGIGRAFMERGFTTATIFAPADGGPEYEELTADGEAAASETEAQTQPQTEAAGDQENKITVAINPDGEVMSEQMSEEEESGPDKYYETDTKRLAQAADILAICAARYMVSNR